MITIGLAIRYAEPRGGDLGIDLTKQSLFVFKYYPVFIFAGSIFASVFLCR